MRPALFAAVLAALPPLAAIAAPAADQTRPARHYYFEGRMLTAETLESENLDRIKDPELRNLAREAAAAGRELAQDLMPPPAPPPKAKRKRSFTYENVPHPGGAKRNLANVFEGDYGRRLATVRRRSGALARRLGPRNRCVVACHRTENRCRDGCAEAQSRTGHRLICGCKATFNRCLLQRLAIDLCG